MGELFEAIERYDRRKEAAASGGAATEVGGLGYHDNAENVVLRRLTSDLDLDLDEVMAAIDAVYRSGMVGLQHRVHPRDVLGGMWVDGLVTGLLLARLRGEAADG